MREGQSSWWLKNGGTAPIGTWVALTSDSQTSVPPRAMLDLIAFSFPYFSLVHELPEERRLGRQPQSSFYTMVTFRRLLQKWLPGCACPLLQSFDIEGPSLP